MRLTGFESLQDIKGAFARQRPSLDRVASYRDRVVGEVRKYPKLAAGIGGAAGVWATLVESFCAMVDPYLSRFFPDVRLVAIVAATGDIALHKVIRGAATPLGTLATIGPTGRAEIAQAKWTAIELRLPQDQLLRRTLSLPAASRDFLGPIIEHRLDRLTPWHPDRVLYGYRSLDDGEPGGGVSVELTATSKDFVAAPLQALADAGVVPTAIGGQGSSITEPLRVDLSRRTTKSPGIDSRRLISRVALTAFGLLAVAWLAAFLWASSAIDQQHEAGVRLLKARRLLKAASMGAIGDRERALIEAKRPDKAVVVLIDKLATAIPQDTYLKELAVTPDKVRLVGISGNAPALIAELETAGLVNVRFTSAVTREKDDKDSFEITADRAAPVLADSP